MLGGVGCSVSTRLRATLNIISDLDSCTLPLVPSLGINVLIATKEQWHVSGQLHFWFHCSRSLASHVQQVSIVVASQLHGLLATELDSPVATCVNECIVMFWILLSSCRTQNQTSSR